MFFLLQLPSNHPLFWNRSCREALCPDGKVKLMLMQDFFFGSTRIEWDENKGQNFLNLVRKRQGTCLVSGMNDVILLAGQESVQGVLVKMAAIRGAGRTINQQWSRGGAGALTEALQFPLPYPYTHTLHPSFLLVLFLSKVCESLEIICECLSWAGGYLCSSRRGGWVTVGWLVAMLHLNQTLIPLVFTPTWLVSSDWWTWFWQGLVPPKANLSKGAVLFLHIEERQTKWEKNKGWKTVYSLPCCPSCLARVATVSNLFLKRRTCSQFSIASSCGAVTEAKLYQHSRPKYTADPLLYS